ncbi:MAG: hypothetical protein GVY33_07170 [Alphaproteobacteria bacterium]|jgi:peroxidase|nr:hypothetical protein [Alphaproteobacteria bacterium]
MTNTPSENALFASLEDLEPRSPDGSGNNRHNEGWGAIGETFVRVENSFPDGEGNDLDEIRIAPAPEEVTETVMNADNGGVEGGEPISVFNAFDVNDYTQFFGQFIAHDLAFSSGGEDDVDGQLNGITRNAGETVDGVRTQINEETAPLDLGHVYDNDPERSPLLRDPASGRMVTREDGLLPGADDIARAHDVEVGEDQLIADRPIITGDFRAAQTEQLVTHHTIWLQNHNYHADRLAAQFPEWSDDQVFRGARALNEAEFQWVVYDEYLPAIIGEENVIEYDGYDKSVNPGIINDFTAAVFRFGHDQANNFFDLLEEDGSVTAKGPGPDGTGADVTLLSSFIPLGGEGAGIAKAQTPADQADWIRGQLGIPHQEIDGFVVSGNRGNLFGIPGRNLEAFDIVRGRDHGVNDYNGFREAHGLERYESWDAFFTANDIGEVRRGHLKDLYGSDAGDIANMDTVIGVLLEQEADGSQLGPTATTVIREQFANLRDGDRFYFENRFTPEQVEEIKATSLADIIERTTAVDHVYRDALIAAPRIGGGEDHDRLDGTADGDLVIGFAGDDRLDGLAGDDDLYGGAGNDRLNGGDGEDLIHGEAGRDVLRGGDHADTLHGGDGGDRLLGGHGDDVLEGGAGFDVLVGGRGEDVLRGGDGTDVMLGGADADSFVYDGGGSDFVMDFTIGVDTLILAGDVEGSGRRLGHHDDFRDLVEETSIDAARGPGLTFDFGDGEQLSLLGVYDVFA